MATVIQITDAQVVFPTTAGLEVVARSCNSLLQLLVVPFAKIKNDLQTENVKIAPSQFPEFCQLINVSVKQQQ